MNAILSLTTEEKELFDHLKQFVKDQEPTLTLRAAGGWVRDKLLGRQNDDIDLALDTLSGVQFAESYSRWIEQRDGTKASYAVIKANALQSKHLETVKMRIKAFEVDIVHLRTDTYTKDSRIPQVGIGTPQEDACRRDFTVNALFYNINEGAIEDFTECGLKHLAQRVLVTPINPYDTFMDDPLRLLRGIRFAATLGFSLDPAIADVATTDDVRRALQTKVSRERMRVELDKAFTKGDCTQALHLLLQQTGIADVVFDLSMSALNAGLSVVNRLLPRVVCDDRRTSLCSASLDRVAVSSDLRISLIYSALYHREPEDHLEKLLKACLKFTSKRSVECKRLIAGAKAWRTLLSGITDIRHYKLGVVLDPALASRDVLRQLILRHLGGQLWESALLLAVAIWDELENEAKHMHQEIVDGMLYRTIEKKCPIDGNSLLSILPDIKGPARKEALDYAMQLCLSMPSYFEERDALNDKIRHRFSA